MKEIGVQYPEKKQCSSQVTDKLYCIKMYQLHLAMRVEYVLS